MKDTGCCQIKSIKKEIGPAWIRKERGHANLKQYY